MIARIWHGWTGPQQADAYEELLRTRILPGIAARGISGYRGAQLLRRPVEDGLEFVTVLWFDSMDAVRDFAGDDPEISVVPPDARALLSRFDERSRHYVTVMAPGLLGPPSGPAVPPSPGAAEDPGRSSDP